MSKGVLAPIIGVFAVVVVVTLAVLQGRAGAPTSRVAPPLGSVSASANARPARAPAAACSGSLREYAEIEAQLSRLQAERGRLYLRQGELLELIRAEAAECGRAP